MVTFWQQPVFYVIPCVSREAILSHLVCNMRGQRAVVVMSHVKQLFIFRCCLRNPINSYTDATFIIVVHEGHKNF